MTEIDTIPYPLVDRAWDVYDRDNAEGVRLARQALDENPTETDAFVILALCSPCRAERVGLLREAMRLGAIEHAAQLSEPDDHTFWGNIATRPYMRAVHNLILDLWKSRSDDDRREAVRLGEHLLHINPRDNQGIRFLLMEWLPILERWDALARLLHQFRDDYRTQTKYTRALLAYRMHEDDADELLDEAMELNPHVPALIKGKRPAEPMDASVTFRSLEEAASYAHGAHPIWDKVPGARAWIAKRLR